MKRTIQLALFAALCAQLAGARGACPVTLISAEGAPGGISVTFRNTGTAPIRRLAFNCRMIDARADKARRATCYEENALFLPDKQYTTRYSFPDGPPGPAVVSLKSVTFSDGHTWKPSRGDSCRTLTIVLKRRPGAQARPEHHPDAPAKRPNP